MSSEEEKEELGGEVEDNQADRDEIQASPEALPAYESANLSKDESESEASPEAIPAPGASVKPNGILMLELEEFSGPLDLLLHLIKKHEMDIFDIPIGEITEKYLAHVEVIRTLDLDRAGDFLVMAATLMHIKSRMLLPPTDEPEDVEEEEGDPREELVRRLLEYQKYKLAAQSLAERPFLGRDVFVRVPDRSMAPKPDEVEMEEVSVFQLIEIFQEVLENIKVRAPHKIELDTVKVDVKIRHVLECLSREKRMTFRSLFDNVFSRPELIATFLAILELTRMKALRIFQTSDAGEIYLSMRKAAPSIDEIMDSITIDRADTNGMLNGEAEILEN